MTTKPLPKRSGIRSVHLLRVELVGTRPLIWRGLSVPSDATLHGLHLAIQAAMPWADSHLHAFRIGRLSIGDPRQDPDNVRADERLLSVADVLPRAGMKMRYIYDFGDHWEHVIRVAEIMTGGRGLPGFGCMAGERAAPPDDCGGVPGYEELVFTVSHPNHARHRELSKWLNESRAEMAEQDERFAEAFDPKVFHLLATNQEVAKLNPRRRGPRSRGQSSR